MCNNASVGLHYMNIFYHFIFCYSTQLYYAKRELKVLNPNLCGTNTHLGEKGQNGSRREKLRLLFE